MREILEKNHVVFKENELLSRHTSFRVGGAAEYFAEPASTQQLVGLLREIKLAGKQFYIMGNGSNLLAPDEGVQGVVICLGERFSDLSLKKSTVIDACAGSLLSKIGRFALAESLAGFEFAHGIPGSLGGAVYMNAGAYGGELSDVVLLVKYLDERLETKEISRADAAFGYRESIFKHKKSWIIIGAEIGLNHGEKSEIEKRMTELNHKRRDKQPLEYPSAGSTFKRPYGQYAAKLIEECGLKGRRVGGAVVSEKHAGFIVNTGGATCADIQKLMDIVKETVFTCTGVMLQPEVEQMRPFTY